jgi:hypothetical protein
MVPSSVSVRPSKEMVDVPSGPASMVSYLARPKSRIFAPAAVNITLPGFKSRWTTCARCACASASAI